jgi:hypothetical protein
MADTGKDLEGVDVVIEIQGVDEAVANELRKIFDGPDEDVVFAHAFGGVDVVSIIVKLGAATIGKLIDFAAKVKTSTPKTVFKIDKSSITMNGFTPEAIQNMLASPDFQRAVRTVQKK